mgnify:CR=1 FL=1
MSAGADAISLLQLGITAEMGTMAVSVEYHEGLGGMGRANATVDGVKIKGCPRGHIELVLGST